LDKELNRSLGISFSSNKICYTELVLDAGMPALDHVESAESDFNFEEDLSRYKSSHKVLTNISGDIQKYLNKRNHSYKTVSLAIGTSQAFLITLPLDLSEGKHSINSKIYWELSNYFPDNYNDFIVNTYRLSSVMPSSGTGEFLIIAVLKNSLEFVKRVFKLCGLELNIVDIDHFATEHIFRNSYPAEVENEDVLIAGIKKGRIDYGVISKRKYSFYTYSKYYSAPELNLSLVRKVNSLLGDRLSRLNIRKIVLYGDTVEDDSVEALKKIPGLKPVVINPFENINSSSVFLKNEELRKISYSFAPSCGVALRSLTGGI
jgi:Tfp pilus assembly PilM family ATPase